MSHVRVIRAVQECESYGLAFVPDVVRKLGKNAEELLRAASRAGVIELRPESGLGRLTEEEKKLCLPGPMGSLLSYIRLC